MGQLEGEEAGTYILGGVAVYPDLRVQESQVQLKDIRHLED